MIDKIARRKGKRIIDWRLGYFHCMTHERRSGAIRIRVGLGLAALCLAAPTVPPALAQDSVPMPAVAEVADAVVNGTVDAAVDATLAAASPLVPSQPAAAPAAALPAVAAAGPTEAPPAAAPAAPPSPSVPPPILAPVSEPQESAGDAPTPDAPPVPEAGTQVSEPVAGRSQVQPVCERVRAHRQPWRQRPRHAGERSGGRCRRRLADGEPGGVSAGATAVSARAAADSGAGRSRRSGRRIADACRCFARARMDVDVELWR